MKEQFFQKLTKLFEEKNISLNEEQKEQFFNYFELLVKTNEKFNLTTITSEEDVIVKHFLDSVLFAHLFKKNAKIIDIGAGAGFPSIPLKIVRPDLKVLMVDSVNKKILFLQEVISLLDLKETSTLHSRAEDLASKTEYREKFDYAVSRAVASLNTLAEYSLPFVKLGGKMIAYKANEIEEEINLSKNAVKLLGGKIEKIEENQICEYVRKAVCILKISSTPSKFPRGGNKPRLMPL